MLSHLEISDRFEIQDLVYRYADIIDQRRFDELNDVFSDDAHIDYSAVGGAVGDKQSTIAFLKKALPAFKCFQHLNANLQIAVNGDTATGRVMCFNPQELMLGKDKSHFFMLGLWYNDEYVRTPQGWRMRKRTEVMSWHFNAPEFMSFVKKT